MTPDKKRAILEAAAKACGEMRSRNIHTGRLSRLAFNPIDNSIDTSSICAKLEINTIWLATSAVCNIFPEPGIGKQHDGTPEGKEAAWRLAASMVAAKIAGYSERDGLPELRMQNDIPIRRRRHYWTS